MTTQTLKAINEFDNLNASQYSIEELYERIGYKKDLAKFPVNKYLALCEEIKTRYTTESVKKINSSEKAYEVLKFLKWEEVEHFYVMLLKNNGELIKTEKVSSGGITGTVVDQRIIFSLAMQTPKCTRIVIAHNHPSGNINPSETDKRLTEKIVQAGKILDIEISDHIIVGGSINSGYFSFKHEGLM